MKNYYNCIEAYIFKVIAGLNCKMSANFVVRGGLTSLGKTFGRNVVSTCFKTFTNQTISSCVLRNVAPWRYYSSNVQKVAFDNCTVEKISNTSNYTTRSCTCGELRIKHVGQNITLCGWLEFQRMNRFVVLRDGYGQTQLLIDEKNKEHQRTIESLPYESIIQVDGEVLARPADMVNKNQVTGEIEVLVKSIKVLNKAKDVLPFNIREFQKAKEALRMQYRYLDLRFPQMQKSLRVRSEVLMDMRSFLCRHANFVDVETPTLFKATPGGAQEFVVPTRFSGLFYSLVQSPQQFKQMLMAGGVDRYFQIARCYRDEGSRPDRQPEFTQLDLEMSFTDTEGVIKVVEDLLNYSWPKFLPSIPEKFPRLKYQDAMELYGSDKPDTRFDFKLQNCTEILEMNPELLCADFGAYYLTFKEPHNHLTSSIRDKLTSLSKQYKTKFVQMKLPNKENWSKKIGKLFGHKVTDALWDELHLKEHSILFLSFGNKKEALSLLGKVRTDYVDHLENRGQKIRSATMNILWITDFPLFEKGEVPNKLYSAHHPFTAPQQDDVHLLDKNPLQVRAQAYDLVLNGNEIGGGSIRIHEPALQEYILKLLDIKKDTLQHMLDMLGSGCPPHGGIALGLDRLMAIIMDVPSIRDVIAFPKTFEGRDPVSGAPSSITDEDKKLYHIQTLNC